MEYQIRTFKEDYLIDQERIGKSVYVNYLVGAQTPAKQLKIAYSRENFDPSTKFYAFENDNTMVGFLTCSILEKKEGEPLTARLEFPFVIQGREEVRDLLYNHALGVLTSKGVQKIVARAGVDWGYTLDYATSKGYTKSEVITRAISVNPQEIPDSFFGDTETVTNFDIADLEALVAGFQKAFNIEDENTLQGIRLSMETLAQDYDVVSHKVIKSGGEIIGRHLFYSRGGNKVVLTGSFLLLGENVEELRSTLLKAGLKQLKKVGRTQVQITVSGKKPEEETKYSDFNKNFYDAWIFVEKTL